MKHTQGEWMHKGYHIFSKEKTFPIGQSFVQQIPCHENKFATDVEGFANAKLMAAAPDLLEALQTLKTAIDYAAENNAVYAIEKQDIDLIQSAIKKATL